MLLSVLWVAGRFSEIEHTGLNVTYGRHQV